MGKSHDEWWIGSTAPLWMRINVTFFAWIFIFILSFIVYNDAKNKTTIELIRILGTLLILYIGALILSKIFVFDKTIILPETHDKKNCSNCQKKDSVLITKVITLWSYGRGFRFTRWKLMWHCNSCGFDEIEIIRDNNQKTWFCFAMMFYSSIVWILLSSILIALL